MRSQSKTIHRADPHSSTGSCEGPRTTAVPLDRQQTVFLASSSSTKHSVATVVLFSSRAINTMPKAGFLVSCSSAFYSPPLKLSRNSPWAIPRRSLLTLLLLRL
ncbi:hypothetical protein B296_00010909 [Ensete ventricosum]|uniref:Uncharacterized protein n=1 Tax=Ensete ventricosum TaxID=4639 RepID=A0A427ATF3_ENSVE|nr:hypothetical protein B296_00010909 [Ensete ventricosum]